MVMWLTIDYWCGPGSGSLITQLSHVQFNPAGRTVMIDWFWWWCWSLLSSNIWQKKKTRIYPASSLLLYEAALLHSLSVLHPGKKYKVKLVNEAWMSQMLIGDMQLKCDRGRNHHIIHPAGGKGCQELALTLGHTENTWLCFPILKMRLTLLTWTTPDRWTAPPSVLSP